MKEHDLRDERQEPDAQPDELPEKVRNMKNQILERDTLLQAAQIAFSEIASVNLSKGTYRIIQYDNTLSVDLNMEGSLEQLFSQRLQQVAPEDQDAFRRNFFPHSMLEAFQRGRDRLQLSYRRIGPDGVLHWIETMAVRQGNPYNDDLLFFAVTRNIDQQKIEAERLQQALAESTDKLEGWLYYNRLSSQSHPGLVYVNYDDGRPSPYEVGTLAKRLDCPPKELALSTCFRIPNEDKGALQLAHEKAKQFGEKTFHAEYRIETDRGEIVWVHNHAIHFEDKDGGTGHIHFLTDTTHEHTLMEQVRRHMEERLKENEHIFNIVAQHSNRTVYRYDLAAGTAHPWNLESEKKDILAHLRAGNYADGKLEKNRFVMPESIEDTKNFFADIYGGVPSGERKVHIRLEDGRIRWYHLQYTSIFDGKKPVTALISVEDITERHEHELAYLRHAQSVVDNAGKNLFYLESCLVCDRVERLSGKMLSEDEIAVSYSHSDFGRLLLAEKFQFEKAEESYRYFSCENLLELYARGERQLQSKWRVHFNDGTPHWLGIDAALTADPFNDHVKAFIRITDITKEQEEQQTLRQQADNDAMTGLLRRGVGEVRIREHMSAHTQPGGILIALDLDDLKGINDTLGHKEGDAAIVGIAETLKRHFRKDDVLIRAGGDEFIVFLPGAAHNVSSVELSLAALLRKLSAISIGENNERTVHCSIGCAVERLDTDTFDTLYQRADIALYHVKRSGKNNFAFFEAAMLEENYRFKLQQAVPVMSDMVKGEDLLPLLEAVSAAYPGIVQFNLTQNYFKILTAVSSVESVHAPDKVDVFWENWRKNIHPDDWGNTIAVMSREKLFSIYIQGKRRFKHSYRNKEAAGYVRTEVDVRFFSVENGDIGAFLFFRWDTGSEKDLEIQRLNKILSLSGMRDFEYICLIDVRGRSYSVLSTDGKNSHMIPETADFDTMTRYIRDTQIPHEKCSTYYENANLDYVLERMNTPGGSYSYQYTMTDAITREAAFTWYEDSHSELLMTVRKISNKA